jgi:hypothetical protein
MGRMLLASCARQPDTCLYALRAGFQTHVIFFSQFMTHRAHMTRKHAVSRFARLRQGACRHEVRIKELRSMPST